MKTIRKIVLSVAAIIAATLVLGPNPDDAIAKKKHTDCSIMHARCIGKCRGGDHCQAMCDMALADCISRGGM